MIDLNQLKQFYKFGQDLHMEDIADLFQVAKQEDYARKELLLQQGSCKNEVFFIVKGLVRCYHINEKGEEITFRLIPEQQFVANTEMIFWEEESKFYYEAFEATNTLSIPYNTLQQIIETHPRLERNRKFVFQKLMLEANQRIQSFILHSPEERYLRYINDYPDMVNRVPDKYIAHVLGITPVSLSRIRKRVAKKKQ